MDYPRIVRIVSMRQSTTLRGYQLVVKIPRDDVTMRITAGAACTTHSLMLMVGGDIWDVWAIGHQLRETDTMDKVWEIFMRCGVERFEP